MVVHISCAGFIVKKNRTNQNHSLRADAHTIKWHKHVNLTVIVKRGKKDVQISTLKYPGWV